MKILTVLTALVLMVSCAGTNTSGGVAPPPSPQQAFQQPVLNSAKLLADAANGAVKSAIALRDQGKITNAAAAYVENYSVVAANLSDAIVNELQSSDSLLTQKLKIIALVQGAAFPAVPGTVPADIVSIVQNMTTLVLRIRMQVGA